MSAYIPPQKTAEFVLHNYSNPKDVYCSLSGAGRDTTYFQVFQVPVRQLEEHVDWKKTKKCIFSTGQKKRDLVDGFRVIDVRGNCIVTPNYPVEYVALSYVWGAPLTEPLTEQPFQASKSNIADLEMEGSLSRAPLPHTIRDAMEACRQLDQQYLWVDRLCIVQDDAASKHGQISRMDAIFGFSTATIVALGGENANDRLPGVSEGRQSQPNILEWQGTYLTEQLPPLSQLVTASTWAQRGWTYQEELCSSNNLYFTKHGVYNSSSVVQHAKGPSIRLSSPLQEFSFPFSVEAYSNRCFTDPGDRLRAFTGVLNRKYGHKHRFGNSTLDFDRWIHWQPLDWKHKPRPSAEVFNIQPHESDTFPSWSWTSPEGGVDFQLLRPFGHVHFAILWAFPIPPDLQKDGDLDWASEEAAAYRLREITVDSGLMSAEEFPIQSTNKKDGLDLTSLALFKKADLDIASEKLGRVISFTQVAFLGLENIDYHYEDGRRTFRIISSEGNHMGGIWLTTSSLEYLCEEDGRLKEMEFEFMALSICDSAGEVEHIISGIGWIEGPTSVEAEKHHTKPDWKSVRNRAALNVMLIWRAENSNVALRLGIGQVFRKEWFESGPSLKTVILE